MICFQGCLSEIIALLMPCLVQFSDVAADNVAVFCVVCVSLLLKLLFVPKDDHRTSRKVGNILKFINHTMVDAASIQFDVIFINFFN